VAKYKKKRARELQHDRFRDTTITFFDRIGDRLEGKGKAILYGILGVVLLAVLVGLWVNWRGRKADEAQQALGRAITIAIAPVSLVPPDTPTTGPTFTNERERGQRAIEEFEKVAAKYGEPYRSEALYFVATNRIYVDRDKAISELTALTSNSNPEVATLSKFALAQTKIADSKFDEAAQLFSEIARVNSTVVTPDIANLHLAEVYEKQNKKKEAADLLFSIVDASRKAKDTDGTSLSPSAAAGEAAKKLQKLDPDRYAQLTPEAPGSELPF
jgi:tetratricopeptide (TPR) repeat protein